MANETEKMTLDRRTVVAALLRDRKDLLVVTGLGSAVWDCAAVGDSPLTFPVWGAMGAASTTGLGLAQAQPDRPVVVITGDGEMLMQLGALATIGVSRPRNLTIVVLDNEVYLETGAQPTHTGSGVDLAAVASACAIPSSSVIRSMAEIEALRDRIHLKDETIFAQVKISPTRASLVMPPRDGSHLKDRFRYALLGEAAYD
ncbi:thiamine pyrophosphate-dependent enzyme [Burkholderia sp. Bp9142]|uniref:thiamine pyrophosphate-dependent enzyme n=1 Tax=Burkholderia sp. Bp9142 TaxID=2184573 RepID=UPI001C8AA307|nr:thiamine pyrophosphate-dependent enzyme [Burkholderia sp. Bp9142]